jgi:ABC-2 type transport system permease protein
MTGFHWLSDIRVMTARCLRHTFRSIDTVITVVAMPILLMLIFVYVFGGAINTGNPGGAYIDYMLPGILLMSISNGVAYAAVRLSNDVTKGIFDRFHSMPIARSSVLWGHVATSAVSCMVSMVLVVLVALLMGFSPSAGVTGWLLAAVVLMLYVLATTWMAVVSALLAKTAEGAGVFSYPLTFLPFLSSAFVPTQSMPGVLRAFAEHQPVTSVVEAVRSLLLKRPVGDSLWVSALWLAGLTVLFYALAMAAYRRRRPV